MSQRPGGYGGGLQSTAGSDRQSESTDRVEWRRPRVQSYDDAVKSADPLFRLLGRALEYVTANVPAFASAYGLIDVTADAYVIGPCVVKLDRAGDLDYAGAYRAYKAHAELDPFTAVMRRRLDATVLTADDVGGIAALECSEFGRGFLSKIGAGPGIRLIMREGEDLVGAIGMHRRAAEPDFTGSEKRFLHMSHGFLQSVHLIAVRRARADGNLPQFVRRFKLSPREQQIVELVASGAANGEIADRLVIAAGTVTRHLHRIYTKVGVGSRAQLAAMIRDRA